MAVGISAFAAANFLNALANGGTFTAGTTDPWIKLHLGDPGAAGTANAALNTTRRQALFNNTLSSTISNASSITWANVPNTEHFTHYSAWDASSAGTFLWSGTCNSVTTTATQDFVVAAGDLDVSVTNVASA